MEIAKNQADAFRDETGHYVDHQGQFKYVTTTKRASWLEKIRCSEESINIELHNAIRLQRIKDVRRLLEGKADPNSRDKITGEAALCPACAKGSIDIVKLLLKRGADPNVVSGSSPRMVPLVLAVIYNRAAVCKLLLAYGADPNGPAPSPTVSMEVSQQEKPIFHAAMGKRLSITRILMYGEWKEIYFRKVQKVLEQAETPAISEHSALLLDFLGLRDVYVDSRPIRNHEIWQFMQAENNPTVRLYNSSRKRSSSRPGSLSRRWSIRNFTRLKSITGGSRRTSKTLSTPTTLG